MLTVLNSLRNQLTQNIDENNLKTSQHFFKETIKLHGVKIPIVTKIGRQYFEQIKHNNKTDIFLLCENLWQTGYIEEAFIACNWSYYIQKNYEPADFIVFEKWINNYVNNWATCDTLCNHTIGTFVQMYPQFANNIVEFTKSDNPWVKRAAAVSFIIPARKGLFFDQIFKIATALMNDKNDLVQKGFGWMLKAASQANQTEVFNFVIKNKSIMPRTALRYAIEKMPVNLKTEAMKK